MERFIITRSGYSIQVSSAHIESSLMEDLSSAVQTLIIRGGEVEVKMFTILRPIYRFWLLLHWIIIYHLISFDSTAV